MSFKSRNRVYSGNVISWESGKKRIFIKKGRKKEGQEKSTGWLISIIASVMPMVVGGALLMGTCVYRGRVQREKFAEYGQEEGQGKIQVVSASVRSEESREGWMIPGRYPEGKPDLELVRDMQEDEEQNEQEKVIDGEALIGIEYIGVARYSYYWPPLGGINCEVPCEIMANGEMWEENLNVTVACPAEWKMGARVVMEIGEFICKDRGQMIIYEDGIPWVDHLSPVPIYDYGELIDIEVYTR